MLKFEEGQTYEAVDGQEQCQDQESRPKQFGCRRGRGYRSYSLLFSYDLCMLLYCLILVIPVHLFHVSLLLNLGVEINDLGFDLIVTTPDGLVVIAALCVRGIIVVIQQRTFS